MPLILPILQYHPASSGSRMWLLPTNKCQCTLSGSSSKLLTLTANLASTVVIILVGALLKKYGGLSFCLCCGLLFSSEIYTPSSVTWTTIFLFPLQETLNYTTSTMLFFLQTKWPCSSSGMRSACHMKNPSKFVVHAFPSLGLKLIPMRCLSRCRWKNVWNLLTPVLPSQYMALAKLLGSSKSS